jgi:hypothetical protein
MIPIHVALVAYDYEDKYVNTSTILRAAAALQMQLTRDFTPIWNIPAVVSAYKSLDDVPPASIPLAIVNPRSLDPRYRGLHRTEAGEPIGVIAGEQGWSLAASHELLEIVCDPQGRSTVLGESIADSAHSNELTSDAEQHPLPQGQVAYLLEICDPCQAPEFAYTVNGIPVSDFVTPRYYAPRDTKYGSYSFTGKVTQPLQILRGGYISWYTYSLPGAPVWQGSRDKNDVLRVGPLGVPPSAFARHPVDHFTDLVSDQEPITPKSDELTMREDLAAESAKRYGEVLRVELERLLATYKADRDDTRVELANLLEILDRLATNKTYWAQFQDDPDALFNEPELQDLPRRSFYPGKRYPSQEEFRAAHDWLSSRTQLDPFIGRVATTLMKGATFAPPRP